MSYDPFASETQIKKKNKFTVTMFCSNTAEEFTLTKQRYSKQLYGVMKI